MVLPDTGLYNAVQRAEKLRKKIEAHQVSICDQSLRATASFGVAILENKTEGSSLLREADERMHTAKVTGKNVVVPNFPGYLDAKFVSKEYSYKCAPGVHVV